ELAAVSEQDRERDLSVAAGRLERESEPAAQLMARGGEVIGQPLEQVSVSGRLYQPDLVVGGERLHDNQAAVEARAEVFDSGASASHRVKISTRLAQRSGVVLELHVGAAGLVAQARARWRTSRGHAHTGDDGEDEARGHRFGESN